MKIISTYILWFLVIPKHPELALKNNSNTLIIQICTVPWVAYVWALPDTGEFMENHKL